MPLLPPTACWKSQLPAMKSSALTSSVVAMKLFTFTVPVSPNTMPFGLSRNTLPFATIAPKICDGFWSWMRFSAVACEFGCANSTV